MNYSTSGVTNIDYFPAQKVSDRQKTKEWYKKNIKAAENLIFFRDNKIRANLQNKITNYDLANDIIHEDDFKEVFNPLGLSGTFPASIKNYPILTPKLDLLIGEEYKRETNFKLVVYNDDAVSSREQAKKDSLFRVVVESIKNNSASEADFKKQIKEIEQYNTYEYQDIRELTGTRILNHLWEEQKIKMKINAGFKDLLISSEEIYRIDIIQGNPTVTRVNPNNLFTLRSGESNYVEDSDIIVEATFEPIGAVIDEFFDELTPKEIDLLESGGMMNNATNGGVLNYQALTPLFNVPGSDSDLITVNGAETSAFGGYFDTEGNVRVLRTRWLGRRKLLEVTSFDPKTGDEVTNLRTSNYKINTDLGETSNTIWINEWYEGVQVADDIFVHCRPREVQFRNVNNPSMCRPGYVGTYFNTNSSRAYSLVDRIKPYQYLYNVFMYKLELVLARYHGPIVEMDVSKKPDDWDFDMWMYYAQVLGFLITDSFNEGKEGEAKGKLAGGMPTASGNKVINPDIGNYIQEIILLLQYIEKQAGRIAGVTEQREGQINSNETVGGVERAVTQSSHTTEPWYACHYDTVQRMLQDLLEAAKYAYKDEENKAVPYFLDDMSVQYLRLDGAMLNESDLGVHLVNSNRIQQVMQKMDMLVQAGLQNDKIGFAQAMDIWLSPSMSDIRRKIEKDEAERMERADGERKEEMESQQQMEAQRLENENTQSELDRELKREELAAKTDIELLKLSKDEGDDKGTEEIRLRMEEMRDRMSHDLEQKKLDEVRRSNKAKEKLEDKKIAVQKMQKKNGQTSK